MLLSNLCYCGPSSVQVIDQFPLCSFHTALKVIWTQPGEILYGVPGRGRLSAILYLFHFLKITLTVDLLTKLLAYCRLAHPSRVQMHRVWTCVFYTDNMFKQVPLIQVRSGGSKSLLKKKLKSCEDQNSCFYVGAVRMMDITDLWHQLAEPVAAKYFLAPLYHLCGSDLATTTLHATRQSEGQTSGYLRYAELSHQMRSGIEAER